MNILIVIALYASVLIASELAIRFFNSSQLTSRKISHVLGSLVSFSLPFFVGYQIAVALGGLFFIVILYSKKKSLLRSIHDKTNQSYGEILFPLGLMLAGIFIWPISVPAYQGACLILGLSDGLAGYLGYEWGKHRYNTFGGWKTYEGTIIFYASTFTILLTYCYIYSSLDSLLKVVIVGVAALTLTIAEGLLSKGFDNLLLPILAGLLLIALL
jgi:phytol kinase